MKKISCTLALLCFVFALSAQTVSAVKAEKEKQVIVAGEFGAPEARASRQYALPAQRIRGFDVIKGLSDDQKNQMKEIRLATQKEKTQLQNQLAEKEAHLRTIEQVDQPDLKAINKTIDEITALKGQIMKSEHGAKMNTRALLTEEQRIQFDAMKSMRTRQASMGARTRVVAKDERTIELDEQQSARKSGKPAPAKGEKGPKGEK